VAVHLLSVSSAHIHVGYNYHTLEALKAYLNACR